MSSDTFQRTITGVSEGLFYDIIVLATNEVGDSALSPAVKVVAAVAPDAPTGLQILAQSSTSITISWFAVTGSANGGSPITSYSVFWKTETDTTYQLSGTTLASVHQITQAVTQPGTVYEFKVRATNGAGTSVDSAVLQAKAADQPSTIAKPIKIYADIHEIQIGWTEPDETGFSAILGYLVYWNGGGSAQIIDTPIHDTASSSVFTYTLYPPNLQAGVRYSFAVASYNDVTTSEKSPILQVIAASVPS